MPPEINEIETIVTDRIVEDGNNNLLQFITTQENMVVNDEPLYLIDSYFRQPSRAEKNNYIFRTTKCSLPIIENERKEWFNNMLNEKIENI